MGSAAGREKNVLNSSHGLQSFAHTPSSEVHVTASSPRSKSKEKQQLFLGSIDTVRDGLCFFLPLPRLHASLAQVLRERAWGSSLGTWRAGRGVCNANAQTERGCVGLGRCNVKVLGLNQAKPVKWSPSLRNTFAEAPFWSRGAAYSPYAINGAQQHLEKIGESGACNTALLAFPIFSNFFVVVVFPAPCEAVRSMSCRRENAICWQSNLFGNHPACLGCLFTEE